MTTSDDKKTLTSTQALNTYFSSLLDEDYMDDDASDALSAEGVDVPSAPVVAEKELSQVQIVENELNADPLFAEQAQEFELESAWALDPELKQKAQPSATVSTPVLEAEKETESLQKLLSQVSSLAEKKVEQATETVVETPAVEPQIVTEVQDIEENIEPEVELTQEITENIDTSVEVEEQTEAQEPEAEWNNIMTSPWFQVLYFDVQGVRFAVPLTELGGIHRLSNELSKIIGRPPWYLGMQINREDQLDVVDTMAWIMPDRVVAEEDWQDYQYVIMLGNSSWGLASVRLEGTERLTPEEVNWRQSAGKRPWLAGMVKGKMCALIHVEALIRMLKSGLDVKDVG